MELAISIISLVTAVIALLTAVLPSAFNTRRNSIEFFNKYYQMKSDVAAALTMYSCFYHNPIDLAKSEGQRLPQNYDDASVELRKLGATSSALAVMLPKKKRKLPISQEALSEVSECLIGLSNSMCTPYNCSSSYEDRDYVDTREARIRELLCIERVIS